jgi:predicted AAA+ superfamily ATPase
MSPLRLSHADRRRKSQGHALHQDRYRFLPQEPALKVDLLYPLILLTSQKFKVSVIDIGLMQRMSHLPVDVEMRHDDLLDIYRGKLAEQFVAQELLVTQNRELYYWAREERNAAAEVDYLIHSEGRVYPVEVKSGKGGSLRSLRLFLDTYAACPEGLVLSSGRYSVLPEQRLRFIPLYFAGAELGRSASMGQPSGA